MKKIHVEVTLKVLMIQNRGGRFTTSVTKIQIKNLERKKPKY